MRNTHKVSTAVLITKISRVYKTQNCTLFIFLAPTGLPILDLRPCVCPSGIFVKLRVLSHILKKIKEQILCRHVQTLRQRHFLGALLELLS